MSIELPLATPATVPLPLTMVPLGTVLPALTILPLATPPLVAPDTLTESVPEALLPGAPVLTPLVLSVLRWLSGSARPVRPPHPAAAKSTKAPGAHGEGRENDALTRGTLAPKQGPDP
jgi:hypothetical protein